MLKFISKQTGDRHTIQPAHWESKDEEFIDCVVQRALIVKATRTSNETNSFLLGGSFLLNTLKLFLWLSKVATDFFFYQTHVRTNLFFLLHLVRSLALFFPVEKCLFELQKTDKNLLAKK